MKKTLVHVHVISVAFVIEQVRLAKTAALTVCVDVSRASLATSATGALSITSTLDHSDAGTS